MTAAAETRRRPDHDVVPRLDHDFNSVDMYDVYRCQLTFREKICGGVPRNKEVIKSWVESKVGHKDEGTDAMAAEAIEAMKDQLEDASWNGFKRDPEHGLYVEPRQIKAMVRESCTLLGFFKKKRGSKQIYQHGLEIKGMVHASRVYLGRDQPDGQDEGPIHVMTPAGPRSALKKLDYILGAVIDFDLWIFGTQAAETRTIGEKDIVRILKFAQENGLGADRSQGHGKFDVTGFFKLQSATLPKAPKD